MVESKIELGSVTMQMRFADMEIAAVNAALQNAEKAFCGVRMPEVSADVLLSAMIDGAMPAEFRADRPVDRAFVGIR